MSDDPLADLIPDPLADLAPPRDYAQRRREQRARGRNTSLGALAGQVGAGAMTAIPDATIGLYGLVTGNETAQNIAQGYSDTVNRTLGVEDPNWYDNTPEFLARTLGGAVVGLPARAASGLARITGLSRVSNTPVMRAAEALTPITLPVTAGNVALNTAGGVVVGAGIQSLQDVASADDTAQAASSNDPLAGMIPPADDPLADLAPQERTTAQIIRDNLPLGVLALLGGAGGAAALRQMRLNQRIAESRDAPAVPATPTQPEVPGGLVSPEAAFGMTRDAQGNLIETVRTESGAERAVRNVLDDTATAQRRVQEAANERFIPQSVADEVNAGFSINTQQAPLQDRTIEAIRQGEFEGIRFERGDEYEIRRVTLGEQEPEAFALYRNARAAQDALDDRKEYARQGNPGTRRLLSNLDDDELERIVAQGQANPRVRELLDADKQDNLKRLEVAVRAGLISQDDARKMASVRPGYLHTLVPGNSPLTRRNMQNDQEPNLVVDPILSRQDAWNDVISRAIENRQRQAMYRAAEQINQNTAQALSRLGIGITGDFNYVSKNATAGTEVLPVMINGKRMGIELAPEIASGARTYPRAIVPFLTGLAQFQRNATTGPLAALFGSVQAGVSAAYGTGLVALNRPRGTYGGYIDRAFGGKLPVIDPTFIVAVGGAAARNLAAESARAVSSQLMRSIYGRGVLANMLQAAGANPQVLQRKLSDIYETSMLAEMRRMGSTGTGLTYDPRAGEMLRLAELARTPEYARMQGADPREKGAAAVAEYARAFGRSVTPAAASRAWRLFTSYLNIISDSPVAAFVMLNRDHLNATTLHGTARRLQGDPASRGAAQAVQMATSVMNYSNISMQATRQVARAFREQPGRVLASVGLVSGIGAAITVLSAMQADEEEGGTRHMTALLNASANRMVGGAYISLPGVDPVNAIRMPMEPILAAPTALATVLLSNAMTAQDGTIMPGMGAALDDFLSGRYASVATTGLSRALNPLNLPPGMNALAQMAGAPDLQNLANIFDPRVGPTPRDIGAPGYANTRLERDPISRNVDLLMSDIATITGEQMMMFYRQMGYGNDAATALTQTMRAGLARNPGAAPLLGFTRGEPQRGAVAEQLGPIEAKAAELAQGFQQSVVRPDVVGTGRMIREVPGTIGGQRVNDSVLPLLMEVRALYNSPPVKAERDARSAAQDEIIRLRSQGADPSVTNQRVNEVVERIRKSNEAILREYLALERRIQHDTGRDFSIARFDPLRSIDQFPRRGE